MTIHVADQADGTKQLRDGSFAQMLKKLNSTEPVTSGCQGWIDELTAAQLGIVQILTALRFRSVDLLALATQGVVKSSRDLEINEVYLDFPGADAADPQTPFAVVQMPDDAVPVQVNRMSGPDVDESTLDVWGPGTALETHGHMQHEFVAHVFLADKDDRAGLRKRLLEIFVTEPESDSNGRRIALPFYFDQPCTYTVVNFSQPDDGESAQAGRWPIVLRLRADVSHVTLVAAPPWMQPELASDVV